MCPPERICVTQGRRALLWRVEAPGHVAARTIEKFMDLIGHRLCILGGNTLRGPKKPVGHAGPQGLYGFRIIICDFPNPRQKPRRYALGPNLARANKPVGHLLGRHFARDNAIDNPVGVVPVIIKTLTPSPVGGVGSPDCR